MHVPGLKKVFCLMTLLGALHTSACRPEEPVVPPKALEASRLAAHAARRATGEGVSGPRPPAHRSAPDAPAASPHPRADGRSRRTIFWESPEDPKPRSRHDAAHYWVGNEWELDIYERDLRNLGGGYIGVGSDQGYLFTGWMRARFAWLIDYDCAVVATHWVYRAFFLKAETPEAFVELWAKRVFESSKALLEKTYRGHPDLKLYKRVFERARRRVYRRLRGLRGRLRRHKVKSFLTHQPEYDFVRQQVRSGRVRPMLVNLLEKKGLTGIGRAARRLAVPIRALYLSNTEEHWRKYTQQFRQNILSLPFDEKSVVLRTLSINAARSVYSYHLQPGLNLVAWLRHRHIRRVFYIKRREVRRARGVKFYRADFDPKPLKRAVRKKTR